MAVRLKAFHIVEVILMALLWAAIALLLLLADAHGEDLTNTNLIPPTPTNVLRKFACQMPQAQAVVVSWTMTNMIFPVECTTDFVTWQHAFDVTNPVWSFTVPMSNALPATFYRVGGPIYRGPWYDLPDTNHP